MRQRMHGADQRDFARGLRRAMTPAEARLWPELRGRRLGVRFRRQEPVGPYIVDFVTFEGRLVVELDGEVHDRWSRDDVRDAWLWGRGFRVLRVENHLVRDDLALVVGWILRLVTHPEDDPEEVVHRRWD